MFVKHLVITLILLINVMGNVLYAGDYNEIVIIFDAEQKFHSELVDSTSSWLLKLNTKNINIAKINSNHAKDYLNKNATKLQLVVCVGTSTTSMVLSLHTALPVYSVAIPRLSYNKLKSTETDTPSEAPPLQFNALFLDQPVSRRLDLIAELLPGSNKIGLLLGPDSQTYENTIQDEIDHRKWQLLSFEVTQQSEIINSLDQILNNSDVLLGLADPLVFNRSSARKILLTAYSWRVPLIGISAAYVRAGALAAVSSTPSQLGRQLAEVLNQYAQAESGLIPTSQYPKYFDVSINFQVAESLGLHLSTESDIKNQIQNREQSR